MEYQHTLLDDDFLNFIVEWIILFSNDKDKATTYVSKYMNDHRNDHDIYVKLLYFLKSSYNNISQFLAGKKVNIFPYEKTELDIDIISNISSSTASKWLAELNSINLLKVIIDGKKSKFVNTFLITFLLRGLRNNSFLNAVKRNIHNLDHNIIKLLIRLIIAIRITFTYDSTLTDQLIKSESMGKIDVELVKKILKEANSPFLIQQDKEESNKILKMQKKLDKLFKILNNEKVSHISVKSNSSSYKVLDKKNFDAYTLFEYLINFDEANLIKQKDLELNECKDNVKKFSLREFDKYLYSNKDTYFIRKYKDKCYRFTPDDFFVILNDARV